MSDNDGENDDLIDTDLSEGPRPIYAARKRRRLNNSRVIETSTESSDQSDYSATSASSRIKPRRKADPVSDSPKAKSKSKYRIHIPKNPQVPSDGFYTQPPLRSSSPYRIGKFYWQKPKRHSPDSPSEVNFSKRPALPAVSLQPKDYHLSSDEAGKPKASSNWVDSESAVYTSHQINHDQNLPPQHSPSLFLHSPSPQSKAPFQDYKDVLADLPSDAFSSSPTSEKSTSEIPVLVSSQQPDAQKWSSQTIQHQGLTAPLTNLRQTTLFGTQAILSQTQAVTKHNWPLANREEEPTHHKLDREALATWVYPTNLGTIREYQYSIVARGLYHNLLVALPTGLGKTFIAATIMLNWFRWTTDAQIVFVAPTKPLVSQQVKACFDIAGIPRSNTTLLTGGTPPGVRAEEWLTKRVFFMTPQTIINDLKTGICDPKRIVLLVVDEAHRATGAYAYVEVVKFISRFNSSYRVLALTATPGSSIEGVQEVIDGLGISRIEIRTEESIDIRQYVHLRRVETVLFEYSEEIVMIMSLYSKAIQPVLNRLNSMNAYWAKDTMTLTPYGCNQARLKWNSSDAGRKANLGIKGMVNTIFALLASIAHGIELLKFHGVGPFFHKAKDFRDGDGDKGGKYRKQIVECDDFQTMMTRVQLWINNPSFVGHPKLDYLQSIVLRHFLDAGEGRGASDPSGTRIMVFAHYRDSAEEIARVLKRNDPMVRPHVFVGQTNSKGSDGMDQKTQLLVIKKFQEGIYNTLVATSIGEEGLDIGEVDLIVCYDASASPIRMLQRMGRTGRKRAGNIVVTLMKGKEEDHFTKAKDNYEKMQKEIASGKRFNFRDDQSRRIVPQDIQPLVDKRLIEIPVENSQADLPEPKKRARPPKRPAKKFHMPDGVRTGFVKASRIDGDEVFSDEGPIICAKAPKAIISSEPIPSLDEVLLTAAEEQELERTYLNVKGNKPQIVDVPRLDTFPTLQRSTRPTKHVRHGRATARFVHMLGSMEDAAKKSDDWHELHLRSEDRELGLAQARKFRTPSTIPTPTAASVSQTDEPHAKKPSYSDSGSDSDLPDFAALIKKNDFASTTTARTSQKASSRRKLRSVMVDDSDEF